MQKLLYVSAAIPYNGIRHAGGQTLNYYVNYVLRQNDIETTMIGFCKEEEKKYFDKETIGLKCFPITTMGTFCANVKRVFFDLCGKYLLGHDNQLSFYLEAKLIKALRRLKESGYEPDIIILEWTVVVLQVNTIKKIYPNAKYIASEHDVSFLGYERKYLQAPERKKKAAKELYEKTKRDEIESLKECDVLMPQSLKDKVILKENGMDEKRIHVLTPYYHNMSYIRRGLSNHDILFWGAMYRPENYEAAIWFIDYVMPLLNENDLRFVVAGNKPPKILKRRSNERVVITGYVKDETSLFAHSLCLVSPLLTGAGIKVKIIEALSAGIPVLTNQIGIEGIPCVNGESYYHCEKPGEYAEVIRSLLEDQEKSIQIVKKGKEVLDKYFDLKRSREEYAFLLRSLKKTNL